MTEVTRILPALEQGASQAASQLRPLIYDRLRVLATQPLARECRVGLFSFLLGAIP
jgi:hypothetical protein